MMGSGSARWGGLAPGVSIAATITLLTAGACAGENGKAVGQPVLPLDPGRTVEFTINEGTWLSLDVSPDGQTVIFELLGDLYTLPITGGKAQQITRGLAFDTQPRFSPDGRNIVFVSDRDGSENVWLVRPDGNQPRQLTTDRLVSFTSPEWTPDGEAIVVSRDAVGLFEHELWQYPAAGGAGKPIINDQTLGPGGGSINLTPGTARNINTGPSYTNFLGASLTPDGERIYLAIARYGCPPADIPLDRWQLASIERGNGALRIEKDMYGGAMRPHVSPDGRWLIYATRQDNETHLLRRNLRTGEDQWFFGPVERDQQEACFSRDLLPGSAFTPDSTAFITTAGGKMIRIEVETGEMAPIPFEADVVADIGPSLDFRFPLQDDEQVFARQVQDARLSPDGRRLAFSAFNRIWVMDYPDGTPRRLTGLETGEHHPAWSADGKSVVFATWSEEIGGHVYRHSPNSDDSPQQLTRTPAFYARPEPHPDGRGIFVLRSPASQRIADQMLAAGRMRMTTRGLRRELHMLPPAGGETRYIADIRTTNPLQFAADSERIYFYSRDAGLVSIGLDGEDPELHLAVTEPSYSWPKALFPAPVSDVRISPDGKHAIARSDDHHIYLVEVGKTRNGTVSLKGASTTDDEVKRLTTLGGDFMTWAPDGKSVVASLGATVFRYALAPQQGVSEPGWRSPYLLEETPVKVPWVTSSRTRTTAIRGGRIITMDGDEILAAGTLVIRGNRIVAVGPEAEVSVPADATIVDATGKTIMPGLFDLHGHVYEVDDPPSTTPWNLLAHLAYGVTSNHDPAGGLDYDLYADMAAAGIVLAPRMSSTGPVISRSFRPSSYEEAENIARRVKTYYGHDRFKLYETGDRRERQWLLIAAQKLRIRPTTETSGDLKLSLTQLIDGYPAQEHNLTTPYYNDVARLVAGAGMIVTNTALVLRGEGGPSARDYYFQYTDVLGDQKFRYFTPDAAREMNLRRRSFWFHKDEHFFGVAAADAGRVVAAGGKVAVGAHGELPGLGIHWELWTLEQGLSNHNILRAGTIWGAESLGYDADLGSLEVGKYADLLILDANPLDDISNTNTIRYVMKDGVLYEGDTLATVWPEKNEAANRYWQNYRHD